MYAVAAVVMGGAAVWVALLGHRPTPTPGTAKPERPTDTVDRKSGLVEDARRRGLVCVLGCALVGSVAAGPAGVLLGGVGGVLLTRTLGRLETPSVARERLRIQRDLPVAVDLLSACALAGLPVMAALPTVARALGGPIAQRFDTLHARWGLGASVPEEWERLAADPALHRLGSAMVRAHRSGAPVVATLGRLASDVRRERRSGLLEAARAVGVKAAAPMAACFLPAFMLIGVVPTIVGGFRHLGL
jgi:Flp pilus assembly protein TadB